MMLPGCQEMVIGTAVLETEAIGVRGRFTNSIAVIVSATASGETGGSSAFGTSAISIKMVWTPRPGNCARKSSNETDTTP